MKPSDAADLVGRLIGAWPTRDITVATRRLYTEALLQFDAFDGDLAVAQIIETQKFPPAVTELIAVAKSVKRDRLELEFDQADRKSLPAETPCTVAEFLASRPDMRDRVAKLGIWSRTLRELGDV